MREEGAVGERPEGATGEKEERAAGKRAEGAAREREVATRSRQLAPGAHHPIVSTRGW